MAEVILEEIKNLRLSLEKYRYTKKIICSKEPGLEMNTEMAKRHQELTGLLTFGIRREDPIHIQIVEELGEKALPLYIEEVSMLPGQKLSSTTTYDGDLIFYPVWDL